MASDPQIFKQNSTLLGEDDTTLPKPAATDSALQRFNTPPTTAYDKINLHSTPKASTSVATQSQLDAAHKTHAAITALSPITSAGATTGGPPKTPADDKASESAPLAQPEDVDDVDTPTNSPSTPRRHQSPRISPSPGIGRGAGRQQTTLDSAQDRSPSPISQPTAGQRTPISDQSSGVGRGSLGPGNRIPPSGRAHSAPAPHRGPRPQHLRVYKKWQPDDKYGPPPPSYDPKEMMEDILLCSTYYSDDESLEAAKSQRSYQGKHHEKYPYADVPSPSSVAEPQSIKDAARDREIEILHIIESLQGNVRELLATQQFHSQLFAKLNTNLDASTDTDNSRPLQDAQVQVQFQQIDHKLTQIDQLDQKLDQLTARLDRMVQNQPIMMDDQITSKFEHILDDLTARVHKMVTSAMQDFAKTIHHKIDHEVDGLRTQMEHNKKRVNSIGQITSELKITSDDHTARLDSCRQKQADLQSSTNQQIAELQSQIHDLQRSTNTRGATMAHQTDQYDMLHQQIAEMRTYISELKETTAILHRKSDALERKSNDLERELNNIKDTRQQDQRTAPPPGTPSRGTVDHGVYIPHHSSPAKYPRPAARDLAQEHPNHIKGSSAAARDASLAPRDQPHALMAAASPSRRDQSTTRDRRSDQPSMALYRGRSRSNSPRYRRQSRTPSPRYRRRSKSPTPPKPAYNDLQQGYSLLAHKLTDLVDKFSQNKPTTTPRRDLPKVNTPTFNGSTDSSFEMWKASLEDMFAYLQWPPNDPMRLLLLPTALTDYAKIHYNSLPPTDKIDYNTAMAALAKTFAVSQQTPTIKAAKLQRRQADTETVREYNLEITKRIQECNITDPERQLEIYMQNLRPDIAQRVLLMVPTSLRHAQTSAEIVEQSLSLQANTVMALNDSAPRRQDNQRMARADTFNRNRRSMSRDRYRSTSQNNRDRNRRSWSRDRQQDRQQQNRNRSTSNNRSPGRYQGRNDSRNNRNRFSRSPTPYARINALDDDLDQPPKN